MTKSLKEKNRIEIIKNIRNANHSFTDKAAFRFKYGHSISSYYDQVDSPKEIKIFKPIYKKLYSIVRGNITHKSNLKLRNYIEDILISTHKHLNVFDFKIILHFQPAFIDQDEISFYLIASIYDHKNDLYIGEINFSYLVFDNKHMVVFNRTTNNVCYESLEYFNKKLEEVEDTDKSISIIAGKSTKHLERFQTISNVVLNYKNEIKKLKENPDFEAYDENVSSYSISFKINKNIFHDFSVNRRLIYLSFMSKSAMGRKMAEFLKQNPYKKNIKNEDYAPIENIDYKNSILEEFINKRFFDKSLMELYQNDKISFEDMMELNAPYIY